MRLLSLLVCSMLFLTGCFERGELGSEDNPVKLYFTPSVDAETIASNSGKLLRFLEKETGLFFKSGIPTNYVAVVEAFGSKRADIGVINSFGYLMANKKYGAQAKLRVIRYGHDYYQGQIIVRKDSDIKKIEDLNNKTFAFTDPSSTSGFMFPKKLMKEHNVSPSNSTFAIKHDNVVTMVYQRQVDAGATYYSAPAEDGTPRDARIRVKTQFPDVLEKIRIIHVTEKIPNDPFVFRKDLPDKVTQPFIAAVKKFIKTEEGKEVFANIYSVDGIVDTKDTDYNSLREVVKALNIDMGQLVK